MSGITPEQIEALDNADALAAFRGRFTLPEGVVYLDGNSLGALPRATPARIADVVQREWGESLIRAWNAHGWIDLAARVADDIAAIVGAEPGSVAVGDSTSVNLFKALFAALDRRPGRSVILTERDNFPTDLYIAHGLAEAFGRGYRVHDVDDPVAALDDRTAVLMLTHVNYRNGAMHDMRAVTNAAHQSGVLTVWDLSHSVGAVPLQLAADGADFAVGCGYKYLNGGPGAPAFLYAAPRFHSVLRSPLTGWLGHAAPFDFDPRYRPAEGIARMVVGTPPILSLAALRIGVQLACEAPMALVRDKSLRITELFISLVEQRCSALGLRLLTPRESRARGSQVSFAHPEGYAIMQALIHRGVIGDFRAPDVLRFGIAPLYLRYADIWTAVDVLHDVLVREEWREPRFMERKLVT